MKQNNFPEEIAFAPMEPPDLVSSARMKPGSRADIAAARGELMAWLDQPIDPEVRRAADTVIGDLGAALIGTTVHPMIKRNLIADVATLERARVHGRRSQGR